MQRIDENTYIDDSLVTCAEYQLFVDEMRAQGKRFQPDHWRSYQFPEGQAHEPILGIRHLDALAFCEWLMPHDRWKYRLLTQEEAMKYPLKSFGKSPVGYWLYGRFQFVWAGFVPIDMRRINLEGISTFDRDIMLLLYRALDQARVRALDLKFAYDIIRALELNSARDLVLDRVLERNLTDQSRAQDLKLALDQTLDIKRTRDLDFDPAFGRLLDLYIYIDIFTLQERIAGRSLPFEGMRLVKERK